MWRTANYTMKAKIVIAVIATVLILITAFFFPFQKLSYRDEKIANQAVLLNIASHYIDLYKYDNNAYPPNLGSLFSVYPELGKKRTEFEGEFGSWIYSHELESENLIYIRNDFPHPDITLSRGGVIRKIWKPGTFDNIK
jgi:hypothetical protein